MNFDRITVAVDFSASSLAALRLAKKIARPGALIRIIHVIDSAVFHRGPSYGDVAVLDAIYQDLIRGAKAEVEVLAEELRATRFRVDIAVRVGRPADEILAAAAGTELIATGTQGRGALARVLVGSVAEEVARRSSIPVLVVREGMDSSAVERILVAVDPTGPSHDAIRAAADLSGRLGARLEAIHAASLPPVLPYASTDAFDQMSRILERHLELAPSLVKAAIQKTIHQDVKVHVVTGKPSHEIARHATAKDIVVCGTHGRSALGRFVFGSVAAKLLRESPAPVLVVRPADDESSRDELEVSTAAAAPRG